MAVVDSKTLEIWVQSGLPDEGELIFNVYLHNLATTDWEVSYKLSQYAALDIEINKRTDALKDIAFPSINKDTIRLLVSGTKYKSKAKDLDQIRSSLEQWIFSILTRIDTFPEDLQIYVENFFLLPDGPNNGHGNGNDSPGYGGSNGNGHSNGHGNIRDYESDDDESHTESEDPSVVSDENSIERKKKKKKVLKGFKKRVTRMFSTKTSFDETPATSPPDPDTISDFRDSQSTITSAANSDFIPVLSLPGQSEKHLIQTSKLLTCKVQRGGERSKGQFIYEIHLYVPGGEKKSYQCGHTFSEFSTLNDQLTIHNGFKIGSAFPPSHSKESIGMKLTEREHAERTRLLDGWIKEVVYSYQHMTESQQSLVKDFLGLNRDLAKCNYIHEKIFHGIVEAPRATFGIAALANTNESFSPMRTPRDSEISEPPNTPSYTQSYLSGSGSASGTSETITARPPLAKRSSTTPITITEINSAAATSAKRRTAYRVKLGSSTSVMNQQPPSSSSLTSSSSSLMHSSQPPSLIRGKETIPEGFNEALSILHESDVKAALIPGTSSSSSSHSDSKNNSNSNNETTTKQNGQAPQVAKSPSQDSRHEQESKGCCCIA